MGEEDVATNCVMTVEFRKVNVEVNAGRSRSGKYWESFPRGSEVKDDQGMWGTSNAEVSYDKLDSLVLDLVLGKVSPSSSLQCSYISLTTIALSAGK